MIPSLRSVAATAPSDAAVRLSAQKIDLFGIRVRWALLVLMGVVLYGTVPAPVIAGLVGALAAAGFLVRRECLDASRYERRGAGAARTLRVVDGLLACGSVWIYGHAGGGIVGGTEWIVGIPFLLLDGYCGRNLKRVLALSGAMSLTTLGGAFLARGPQGAVAPVAAIVVSGLVGGAFARFQIREYDLHRRDRRLSTLMSTSAALAASESLPRLIAHTLKAAVCDLGASAGIIALVSEEDKDLLVTESAYSPRGEFAFPETIVVGEGVSGYVVQMGQPVALAASAGEELVCDGISGTARSAVSVPLVNRAFAGAGQAGLDEIVGAMTLVRDDDAGAVQGEDLEMLQSLSALLASAVHNARMEERQRATFLRTLESLATALEARDDYTRGHSQRVCELSGMIGHRLGLSPEALEELRVGTILHDIGKIGVPDAILNKPGRLLDEEFRVMRQHPVIGYEICRPLMLSEGVLMIIRNHHEKLDGSGYPDGLKGGELPLSLRVVCVADAFDAMSSRRPYRGVMDLRRVVGELSKGAGVQFDPVVVEAIKELLFAGELDATYRAFWSAGAAELMAAPIEARAA